MTATSPLGSHRNRQRCQHYCQQLVAIELWRGWLQHLWPNGACVVLTLRGSKVGTNPKQKSAQPSGKCTYRPSRQWSLARIGERTSSSTSPALAPMQQATQNHVLGQMCWILPPSCEPAGPERASCSWRCRRADFEATERRKRMQDDDENASHDEKDDASSPTRAAKPQKADAAAHNVGRHTSESANNLSSLDRFHLRDAAEKEACPSN